MPSPLPWQEQPIVVLSDAMRTGRSALDASDCGIGKTYHTLFAARETGKDLVVIVPKVGVPGWHRAAEAMKVKLHYCGNVESLKQCKTPFLQRGLYKSWKWSVPKNAVVVADEAHVFSGHNSQNGKILNSCPRPVTMLSATVADSPLKMRAVGSQLGLTSWQSWESWIGQHGCKYGHFGGYEWIGNSQDENDQRIAREVMDRLHRQIFRTGRGVRVRISELGDLFPPQTIDVLRVPVEDPEAVNDAYIEELLALKEEAPNALAVQTRCRQIVEHQKIPALIELRNLYREEGQSVIVFVNYQETLHRLVEAFDCPFIIGDQTDREAQRKCFHSNAKRDIVVMSEAGGMSCDLDDIDGRFPRSTLICPGFRAPVIKQAMGRPLRATTKSPVKHHFVIAVGTIDEQVGDRLEAKMGNMDTLNDGDLMPNRCDSHAKS